MEGWFSRIWAGLSFEGRLIFQDLDRFEFWCKVEFLRSGTWSYLEFIIRVFSGYPVSSHPSLLKGCSQYINNKAKCQFKFALSKSWNTMSFKSLNRSRTTLHQKWKFTGLYQSTDLTCLNTVINGKYWLFSKQVSLSRARKNSLNSTQT